MRTLFLRQKLNNVDRGSYNNVSRYPGTILSKRGRVIERQSHITIMTFNIPILVNSDNIQIQVTRIVIQLLIITSCSIDRTIDV